MDREEEMKIWHKKKNGSILDIQTFLNFWIEKIPDQQFALFGKDNTKDETEWKMGVFCD